VTKTGEWSEDKSRHDFATAKSEEIPFVTQKSIRSGILFTSDGQYVGCPVERWVRLLLSIVLSRTRPRGVMSYGKINHELEMTWKEPAVA
jgi:hypothetical protein